MFGIEHTTVGASTMVRFYRMAHDNAYTRTFGRAIQTLGSVERVAHALGVTVPDIEDWAAGRSNPPPGAFLKAIDIVAMPGKKPDVFLM